MKNQKAEKRKTCTFLRTVLGGVLLIAAAGCIRIVLKVTQTTQTAPSTYAAPAHLPPPSGGTFVSSQATTTSPNGNSTVCTHPVSGTYVAFIFNIPGENSIYTQTPPAGMTGWQGSILDETGAKVPNTQYILQILVSGTLKNCCTNVLSPPGPVNEVGTNIWVHTPGYPHRFTAHFITAPSGSHTYTVNGGWH